MLIWQFNDHIERTGDEDEVYLFKIDYREDFCEEYLSNFILEFIYD